MQKKRKIIGGLLGVAVVGTIVTLGVADRTDPPGFCATVLELPALATSTGRDGTPGRALVEYADRLDAAADVAPDRGIADAARTIADRQRRLGELLSGDVASDDLVASVAALDDDGPSIADARERLDDGIADCR